MSKKFSAKKATYSILGSTADLLIWLTALTGASIGKTGPRGISTAFKEADEILKRVNHRTITATWHQLRRKRLTSYKKRKGLYSPIVTEYGLKRLKEKLPKFHKERPWDGKIYLITYDVPEAKSRKRQYLRKFIKNIGAAPLQMSVWLTPYNPRQLLNRFVRNNKIEGSIIVSDVGKDGGVGETSIQDLLVKLYNLEKLNSRYEEFIKQAESKTGSLSYLLLKYLSILKDDPQLPFELLPKRWLGSVAQKVCQKLVSENTITKHFPEII